MDDTTEEKMEFKCESCGNKSETAGTCCGREMKSCENCGDHEEGENIEGTCNC